MVSTHKRGKLIGVISCSDIGSANEFIVLYCRKFLRNVTSEELPSPLQKPAIDGSHYAQDQDCTAIAKSAPNKALQDGFALSMVIVVSHHDFNNKTPSSLLRKDIAMC